MRRREVRQWYIPGRESPSDRIWTEVQLPVSELFEMLGLPPGTHPISFTYDRDFTQLTLTVEEPREAHCQDEQASSGDSRSASASA